MLLYTSEKAVSAPVSTPDQLTADQNDYNFLFTGTTAYRTQNDEQTLQRLSSDATRTITGIVAKGHSFVYVLANVGSNSIALANQSSLSAAANRIITGTSGTVTLAAGEMITLIYDSTTERWRCLPKVYSAGGSGLAIQDEGGAVATATTLNFVGAGVSAVDQGGGVVDVTVTSSGISDETSVINILTYGAL